MKFFHEASKDNFQYLVTIFPVTNFLTNLQRSFTNAVSMRFLILANRSLKRSMSIFLLNKLWNARESDDFWDYNNHKLWMSFCGKRGLFLNVEEEQIPCTESLKYEVCSKHTWTIWIARLELVSGETAWCRLVRTDQLIKTPFSCRRSSSSFVNKLHGFK